MNMLPGPDSIRILSLLISFSFLALGLKRPIFLFLGFMYFFYWKVAHYFPILIGLKAELVYGLISIIMIFILYPSTSHEVKKDSIVKLFYWFLCAYGISFVFAWDHTFSWDNAVYPFIKILIVAFGVIVAVRDEVDVKIVVWGVVLMYVYLAYEPMFRFLTKTAATVKMYGNTYISDIGIFSGHVSLANNMNQMIPIAALLILTVKNKILRFVSAVPLLMFLLCLVGSRSRGGVVGLIVLALLVLFFARSLLRSKMALVVIVATGIVFGGVLLGTFSRIDASSTEGRLVRVLHGADMILKGNVFGVGPGCYILASGRYYGHTMMSHNLYGQLLGDLGIPGALTWLLFMGAILSRLNSLRKEFMGSLGGQNSMWYFICVGLLLSLLVRLFVGLGSHSLYFFNWYVLGILAVHISRLCSQEIPAEDKVKIRGN